jgi:topoisomerase IA-like protein
VDFGKRGPFVQKAQIVAPYTKFNRFEKLTSQKIRKKLTYKTCFPAALGTVQKKHIWVKCGPFGPPFAISVRK